MEGESIPLNNFCCEELFKPPSTATANNVHLDIVMYGSKIELAVNYMYLFHFVPP